MNGLHLSPVRSTRNRIGELVFLLASLGVVLTLAGYSRPSQKKKAARHSVDDSTTQRTEQYCKNQAASGRLLVKLQPGKWDTAALENLAEKITGEKAVAEPVGDGEVILFSWPVTDLSITELKEQFEQDQYKQIVDYAEPDYLVPLDCDEPAAGHNQYLAEQWGLDKISVCAAWKKGAQGKDVVVAVIDTGIDCKYQTPKPVCHEDLKDNIWFPPKGFSVQLGARKVTCPTEGCFGFNAMVADSAADNDKWFPAGYSGHGTQVSGVFAAEATDPGVVGVSYKSKVLMVQYADSKGGFVSSLKRAIDFVIVASKQIKGLRIVNCSFGFDVESLTECESRTLRAEFDHLREANILVVASDGNAHGTPNHLHYPANYEFPNIIAVAGTNDQDLISKSSSFDPRAKNLVGAPGESIYTTWRGNKYFKSDGTSVAGPFVAGTAALVLSYRDCHKLSADELRNELLAQADKVPNLRKNIMNGRRLNADKAVKNCDQIP